MRVEALGHDCRQSRPANGPAETLRNLQLSKKSPGADLAVAKPVQMTCVIILNNFLRYPNPFVETFVQ